MKHEDKINLILKYYDNIMSEEEWQTLEHLLCRDAEFQDLFLRLSFQNVLLYKEYSTGGKHALIHRKTVNWQFRWVAAAALIIGTLTGISWFLFFPSYPKPSISGPVHIAENRPLTRGTKLKTQGTPASLHLGGYCTIDIAPETTVVLQGEPSREAVFVEQGKITCDVVPNSGSFDVHTMLGVVSVKGTRFSVTVCCGDSQRDADTYQMEVSVQSGRVVAANDQKEYVLGAGDILILPEPEDVPDIHTQGGPMVTEGNSLYIATQTHLSKVDSATGRIVMKKDISFTHTTVTVEVDQKNIRKSMLSGKQLYFLKRFPDAGKCVLLLTPDNILLLRNGILFIFRKDTLEYTGYKSTIPGNK